MTENKNTATENRFVLDQREMRARQFSNLIYYNFRKFIPEACKRDVLNELFKIAYEKNLRIVEIPAEMDTLEYLKLEMAKFEINSILK